MKHVLLMLLFTVGLYAQSAVFLLISPATIMNGMGELGVGLPFEDVTAAYYNPANGFSNQPGLSLGGSHLKTKWLPGLIDDMYLYHDHYGLSYKFKDLPFQLNLQSYKTFLDAGEQTFWDTSGADLGTFEPFFSAKSTVIAGRYSAEDWNIPLVISYGFTRKDIIQDLTNGLQIEGQVSRAENVVYDRGFLAEFPLDFNPKNDVSSIKVRPSFGVSTLNIGDFVVFNKNEQKDPLPTVVRAGIGLSTSISWGENWSIIEYRVGHAATDNLHIPRRAYDQSIAYQKGLGDIDLYKHVLKSETSGEVMISRGHELTLLDFYSIRYGRYIDIDGRINNFESGISYNSYGLLKLVFQLTGSKFIDVINRHVQLTYNHAAWTTHSLTHPLNGTEFENWNISFTNLLEISNSLSEHSAPRLPPFSDRLSFLIGANFPAPIPADNNDSSIEVKGIGYSLGVEALWEPIMLGFALTESKHQHDYSTFASSNAYDVSDVYYQLSMYGAFPLTLNRWLTLSAGPQLQSPLIHRKVILGDEKIEDTQYAENYGLRASLDFRVTNKYGLRLTYSYWYKEMEYLFLQSIKFKPAGIQAELKLTL